MNQDKLHFLQHQYLLLLQNIASDATGKWGKMNGQQMVEHVADFFKVSTNKLHFPLMTPEEHLPKFKEFLLSEKEFRENTKAPVLPESPLPVRHTNMQASLDELSMEVNDFISYFSADPGKKTLHPAFGKLNFEEWVQLHHKHVIHHLKQFGLI
jgi:oxepin-CoA hydrolase/3-oxo-5,6-dehydrosuberyl-CoA semialdehyde dehydrogenase